MFNMLALESWCDGPVTEKKILYGSDSEKHLTEWKITIFNQTVLKYEINVVSLLHRSSH